MLHTAMRAAREAGRLLLEAAHGEIQVDRLERRDIKLAVDRRAEEAIIAVLRERFPEHAILSEECGRVGGDSEYLWIVDPLDGTYNYFRGIPLWCTSIALRKGDEYLVGVIYDPVRDELFRAEKGRGAFLDERPIRISRTAELSASVINFGLGHKGGSIRATMRAVSQLALKIGRTRQLGSAAIHLAYVASGRAEGFLQFGIKLWDLAAGVALIREAGGSAEVRQNPEGSLDVVASNGIIHAELLAELGW